MHQLGNQLTRLSIVPHPLALLLRTFDVAASNDVGGFVLLARPLPSWLLCGFVTALPLESSTPLTVPRSVGEAWSMNATQPTPEIGIK